MIPWRFYDPTTGLFHRRQLTCPKEQLAANTPAGYVPIRGAYDPLSQRVDIAGTPDENGDLPVVDWQPPAPDADQWQTWTWDAGIKRWVSVPTLAAIKRNARQRMAQAWDAARQEGVTVGGKVAPTDAPAWTRYLAIKQMAADGGWMDIPIPLIDGTFHLLTQAQAGTLWTALKTMERDLLTRLRDRVDSINAATTPEQVSAVQW